MLYQTRTKSSPSVRVFYLNRPKTIQRLRQAIARLRSQHPEIERAVLFGSLCRGDAVPGSDADVLLVLRESALPFRERSVYFTPQNIGIGIDIFAYTRSELDAMYTAKNTFVRRALREGMDLV